MFPKWAFPKCQPFNYDHGKNQLFWDFICIIVILPILDLYRKPTILGHITQFI